MDSLLPFLQGSFIPYNVPVYPGALRFADRSRVIAWWLESSCGVSPPLLVEPHTGVTNRNTSVQNTRWLI
jgi:hypothetical protein